MTDIFIQNIRIPICISSFIIGLSSSCLLKLDIIKPKKDFLGKDLHVIYDKMFYSIK